MLNYKKTLFWGIIAALTVCVAIAVCFLTNPKKKNEVVEIASVETIPEETANDASYRIIALGKSYDRSEVLPEDRAEAMFCGYLTDYNALYEDWSSYDNRPNRVEYNTYMQEVQILQEMIEFCAEGELRNDLEARLDMCHSFIDEYRENMVVIYGKEYEITEENFNPSLDKQYLKMVVGEINRCQTEEQFNGYETGAKLYYTYQSERVNLNELLGYCNAEELKTVLERQIELCDRNIQKFIENPENEGVVLNYAVLPENDSYICRVLLIQNQDIVETGIEVPEEILVLYNEVNKYNAYLSSMQTSDVYIVNMGEFSDQTPEEVEAMSASEIAMILGNVGIQYNQKLEQYVKNYDFS